MYFSLNEKVDNTPLLHGFKRIATDDFVCCIHNTCLVKDEIQRNQILNCIYLFLLERPFAVPETSIFWWFVFDSSQKYFINETKHIVNVYYLYRDYPKTLSEKIDKVLLNLSKILKNQLSILPNSVYTNQKRLFLPEKDSLSYFPTRCCLTEMGYYDEKNNRLTVKAWERIGAIYDEKKIFIASKFNGYKEVIAVIKQTIINCGFTPVCMDDYQTNDYIMPEIFH